MNVSVDSTKTANMDESSEDRPAKKLKKQDFNLCLICNAKKKGISLSRWTQLSWDTFCSAARRTQDETFTRLETFISGREELPDEISQLKKHEDCYSNYINPKTVDQEEQKRPHHVTTAIPSTAGLVVKEQHQFGITPPPLLKYLKDILRDYSDGQIIKELVQNAEDAGADTVKFMYDVRQYETKTLYKPSLAPYQGHAFYSFNNAKFKEMDWDGIQKPARSNKKTDRLKVGRFGIGFNSVYHITDLPSIMSDQTLAFIDPLEEHFLDQRGRVQTGWRFDLSSDGKTFTKYKDQFEPYHNIFPAVKGGISTGHFDGTLFRFPLRPTANKLSDKTYNDAVKMDELLQAFRVDADVVMLFLRGLNNIEVLKLPSGQQEPYLVVRVQREHDHDTQTEDFSTRLKSYCDDVRGDRESVEMTGIVTFATETQETSKKQRWVLSHLIAGDSMSTELSDLAEKQSHLPWTAVAIPISSSQPNPAACEAENHNIGRVFCFLPLPPGEESRTGLPVHIHGFFGVNSDRRGIKWPGPDQTDIAAQWNRLLVSELIPITYVHAIKYAISIHTSQQGVTTDCIYRSWPDHEVVYSNWDILLEPFYNALFREAIIHSDNKGWMNIADIHFNELTVGRDMEKVILKCFNMGGIAYANVPPVCRQAIKKFYKDQTSTVSASSLCGCLREDPSILKKLNTEEKLLILEFILSEEADQDLQGLPLLPLDDDSFHIFSRSEQIVYIPTSKFHRQLVPGGYQQFIRTIPKEQPLHQLLYKMDGRYQLKSLTLDAVAELLKTSMETWTDDQGTWVKNTRGPSLNVWLDEVWSMLYRECSSKLLLFEGIPLVPLIDAHEEIERLLPLLPDSRVIQRSRTSDGDFALTNGLESVLQQLGVTVTSCPEYIFSHPAVMRDEYIKMPTPEGVVKCLLLSDVKLSIEKVKSISSCNREILMECLTQAKLSGDGKKFLRCLPLFEPVAGTGSSNEPLVSIEKCKGYIECCLIDIPNPLKLAGLLIDGRAKSKSLLQKLEVCRLSKHQVIMDVLDEIDNGQLYTVAESQLILQWIMERWEDVNVNCKGSKDILRRLKVIPNLKKSLMSPPELLDPSDQVLQKLFASQSVFPVAPFDSPDIIAAFKQLGMRGQNKVTAEELIACVDMIEKSRCPIKAREVLKLLNNNPDHFHNSLDDGTVAEIMKDKRFIPCNESPPEYYPPDIEWRGKTSSCLSTPLEVLIESKKAVLISGASRSFVSHEDLFSTALTKLGITSNTPILSDVIEQLENCVRYTTHRPDQDVTDVIPMVKEIYSFLTDALQQDSNVRSRILDRATYCIWNGNGFSEPSKMCSGKLPFDLAPYMASIPQSTCAFKDLFEALGVKRNMDTNADALVEVLHEIKRGDDPGENAAFRQGQRQLVLQILHHLHATGELSEDAQRRLLVPSHKEGCRLIPVKESAYVDKDWLRQSTDNEEMDDDEDFTLIHPDISMDLARFLHVRPVSRLLLDSEELEGFTQAGQHEPLTVRLSNILKNNHLNTAIVNEMIQNAEDAGAQEVRFLVDMRKNENANKKLFDPGMKSCQGPALWVYNDAVFTDEDFENILRLGGRTKEKNAEKIGKFGTGFNSVYHITDVPSFVSREYVQFFDPHTTHLGNVLHNKSQPGVRLKLNTTKLRRFPDQFKPFNGVFGINLNEGNEPFDYHGTLFRLPLRSKEAAQKSQICNESYDGEKLISLMQKMWESSQDLLVFTRKITKVAVFYLGEHATDPAEAEELFTIQKTIDPESIRNKDDATVLSTESFRCTMTSKGNEVVSQAPEVDGHLTTVRVLCKTSKQAASLAQSPDGKECGLLPEGAVAFPLHRQPISAFKKQLYCFLPLSITSTFPVHINGSFAVKEDRRSLHMPVPDAGIISEKWNHILLTDVICRAYVSLLSDIEFIQQVKNTYGSDFSPESLWPDIDEVPKNSACSALFDAFYKAMIQGLDDHEPSLFWKEGKMYQFTKVVFLGEDVQKEKSVSDVVMKVLQDHLVSVEVVTLTEKTWRAVDRVGLRSEVITRTYDFKRFFDEIFLPQIKRVAEDMRNQLVLFALNNSEGMLRQKLRDVDCIPVVGGTELRKPCDLVHPQEEAAPLFSKSDKVFPLGEKFNTSDTLASLSQLGMIEDSLREDIFLERCETVHELHSTNPTLAQNRCYAVLKYLSESLGNRNWSGKDALKEKLKEIPFLPILSESNREKALPWMETNDSCAYKSAQDVYSHSTRYLVSSTSDVVENTQMCQLSRDVEEFLGLADKVPSVQEVLKQFLNFRNHYEMMNDYISDVPIESICTAVYKRIESACEVNCPDIIIEGLQDQRLFLVERKFVLASKIAEGGPDLPPYLFKSSPFLNQFPHLMRHASLKSAFDDGDYHVVLQSIYEGNRGQALDNDVVELAIRAADRFSSFVKKDESHTLDAFLPDERSYMRPVSELCYCDVVWFKHEEIELHKCHMNISFALAKKLKVKDIRQQMLRSYDMTFPGEEFGQREELTNRLKRILESYPSDDTILKELLQNADDAGATEIHFVYDPRSHDGEKILGDGMKSLQGPALCVFNNKSFSDGDIRGIQNLGEGSKADHMGKIGRYGVGFNAVYQLTDCPSFISNHANGDRLCMFDPLLKYVPGSTPSRPGRLIRVDDSVRVSYPDVFPCYLEEKLSHGQEDFTVFRFPLRQETSKLSENVWQAGKIRNLLEDFEIAAFESLLFLKNITKISISEVTKSGAIGSTKSICAEMSALESEKKTHFLGKVQEFATQSNGNLEPEPAGVVYEMKLKGTEREEDWVICQQVGNTEKGVENSMRKYKLLPVGAVAARLTDIEEGFKGKAFCFLPLPINTGLPVHVHGYFALDHESRRHLWEGSESDEQTKWNCHITQLIIAPAYVKLLSWIQEFFVRKYEWSGTITGEQAVLTLLQKYHTFFPSISDKGSYWTELGNTVYEGVASKALKLFPSIYREYDGQFSLKWKTPMQSRDESNMGYFNTLPNQMSYYYNAPTSRHNSKKQEDNKQLRETLIEITFPLLESPTRIMGRLRNACNRLNNETTQYEVLEVSPSNVISFLRSDNLLQRQLPMVLSKSRLHDEESLMRLITYCKNVKNPNIFFDNLHGLSLLLTNDGLLRRFSHDEPVFASEYCDLFKARSHTFLHERFLHILPGKSNVFCELDVTAVSVLLRECTPFLECDSDEIIPLEEHLSPDWFGRLFSLLESFCKKVKCSDIADDIRAELSRWAILPITQTQNQHPLRSYSNQEIKQVAPISLAPTIIIPPAADPEKWNWPMYSALESLNVYQVENSTLHEDNCRLIQHLVTHKDVNFRVLDVLMYWVVRDPRRFQNLNPVQHREILEHFRYCNSSTDLTRLKSLPCFQTIGDDFVSIAGCDKVLVLPSMIPRKEQKTWVNTTNVVFLQYNQLLEALYTRLGLSNTTEIDVYAVYICPAFDRFSEDSRLEHLKRVKELLAPMSLVFRKDTIRRLRLTDLRFITGADGELMKAGNLYDPRKEIFSLMLSKNQFPPPHIEKSLGLAFLREIGLQVDVTRDLYLSFAKQVHKSDHAEMEKKSRTLVSELRCNCKLHKDPSFLQLVSEVDFLVSDGISEEMESLHPPFVKTGALTSYCKTTAHKHIQLIWSTNSILPTYASISCSSCKTTFDGKMGVSTEPELQSVIQHSRNICKRLEQRNDKKLSFPEELVGVLQAIFTFLSSKCAGQSCCQEKPCDNCFLVQLELQNVPIVFLELEDEHRLVKAKQISRTIEEHLEPFLYQLPDRWVPFFKIFRILGGSVKPTMGQYAFVLESIYKRGQSSWSNPNVINLVDRATCGLYQELMKTDLALVAAAFVPEHSLYLPSRQNTLTRSDHLLINDVHHYTTRLCRSKQPLIKIFPSHDRIAREAIAKLPEKLKPKAVSKEVRELLRITGNDSRKCLRINGDEPCEFKRRLQILHSKEFLKAVCCIMRHNKKKVDEETKQGFKDRLSRLKITCLQELHSILQINGENIEGSETEVLSFINDDNELFVQHKEGGSRMETLLNVAMHVNQYLGNIFEEKYMSILLSQESPATIMKALATSNIPVEMTEEDISFQLPPPGSTIPEQLYHLLEQDPWTSFSVGDYVAYAHTDGDDDYYIYAVVVKRVRNESLKSLYEIDIGTGSHIEANVLDMHKIDIPGSISGVELVPSENKNSGETDVEEAKRQVTTELEEIWQLPEEQKRKALRRLMLKWHPDKHPEGPKELFHEAFKHLQSEIERLANSLSGTGSLYEDVFRAANQRARADRRRYTRFGGSTSRFWRRGGGQRFHSGNSSSESSNYHHFFTNAPDIRNARRWLCQGQEDLRAAQHDLDPQDEPSLEWVAYKCHQSVEKALKAAQIAIRGHYDSSHFICSLASDVSNQCKKSPEFLENVSQLSILVQDQRARYPDRCAFSEIPHEAFKDKAKAEEMIRLAASILDVVQTFVQSR